MLIVSSCELFTSYITCDLIILLYMCIIYWWSISTVSLFLLLLYIVVVFCACVCLCLFAWFKIKIDWLIACIFAKNVDNVLSSGRITRGPRGPGPPERPGGTLETPGLRGYKGASKRPPWNQIQYMIVTYYSKHRWWCIVPGYTWLINHAQFLIRRMSPKNYTCSAHLCVFINTNYTI